MSYYKIDESYLWVVGYLRRCSRHIEANLFRTALSLVILMADNDFPLKISSILNFFPYSLFSFILSNASRIA